VRATGDAAASGRAWRLRLAAILLAGLLLRLAVLAWIPTRPVSDFLGYFLRSESIARLGTDEIRPGEPDTSHPPAYPIALSAFLRAAPSHGLAAAKGANAVFGLLTALLGAILARGLWGDAAGLWTAAIFSLFPRSLLMTDLVASENLFSPLWILFLLVASRRWIGSASLPLAAAAGIAIGLLTMTRSVAYFLPLVWLAGVAAGRSRRPRLVAAELAILLAAEHAVLLPWAARNARAIGRFTFLSTAGGSGLFIGNNPRATGDWYDWQADLERLRPGVGARGPLAVDDAAREEAVRWIRGNPGKAAALYVRKLRIVATDDSFVAGMAIFGEGISPPYPPADVLPGSHPLKSHRRAVSFLLRAAGIALALVGLGGFLVLLARARASSVADRALAAGFVAAALYVPVVSAAIAVNGRYRWPAEDAIAPLAGLGLARLAASRRSGSRPGFAANR
jgi:4-amino-4-deoxy-L-arabinose transferase-like glycosyltransferase